MIFVRARRKDAEPIIPRMSSWVIGSFYLGDKK